MDVTPHAVVRASRGRSRREGLATAGLTTTGLLAVVITLAIIALFIAGSVPFFREVQLGDFVEGTRWAPLHEPASYGILPLVGATVVTTGIALAVAMPLGLLSAVFLSTYAPSSVRRILKPALELLAGVPTVVYGFFALRFVTPLLQGFIPALGFWNGLSAGLVMGVMIVPCVASLSEDVLYAVPRSLWEGSYALGATRFETVVRVVVPAALSGLGAAFIWSAVFAIGLLLFLTTLVLNTVSYLVIRRFRERYA